MKAVNLIPAESRRGGERPSRSGGAVYGVLGVLALAVLVLTGVTVSGRSITERTAAVAAAEQQAVTAEAQAAGLNDYTAFASLRKRRVDTVTQLAKSRFDWSHSLHELARVIPATASLTSVSGTVSPEVAVEGGSANPLRGALPNPALSLEGCARTQDDVARLVSRLRLMDDVERVTLSGSAKPDTQTLDCQQGGKRSPVFSMVVFYKPMSGAVIATATTAAPTAEQALASANGTTTTPAAGTATTPATATTATTPAATPEATR